MRNPMTALFRALLIFALGLIAGGFSESTAVLLMWLPLVWWFAGTRRIVSLRLLVAWWAGLAVALAVMLLTPGAQLRAAHNGAQSFDALQWVLALWLVQPYLWLGNVIGLLLAFLVGAVAPVRLSRRFVVLLWWIALTALFTTMVMVARGNGSPAYYTLSSPLMLLTLAAWASGCRWAHKERLSMFRYALVMVSVAALATTGLLLLVRADFALKWQQRDAAIRGGQTTVSVIDDYDSFNPPTGIYLQSLERWYNAELEVVR